MVIAVSDFVWGSKSGTGNSHAPCNAGASLVIIMLRLPIGPVVQIAFIRESERYHGVTVWGTICCQPQHWNVMLWGTCFSMEPGETAVALAWEKKLTVCHLNAARSVYLVMICSCDDDSFSRWLIIMTIWCITFFAFSMHFIVARLDDLTTNVTSQCAYDMLN